MKTRVLSTLLALLLILSLAACGSSGNGSSSPEESASAGESQQTGPVSAKPFEKYEPSLPVTSVLEISADYVYPEGDDAENNIYTRTFQEELGIDLSYEWVAYSGNAEDKIKMMISSDSLPDVLKVNRQTFETLVKAGKVEDLTEAFEKCASDNLKSYLPEGGPARNASTKDGRLYAVPNHNDYKESATMVWVRTDWLTKLGLEPPKTAQELMAVAEAFTTGDPDGNGMDDTYGFGFDGTLGIGDVYWNMFGSYPKIWIEDADGSLVDGMFGNEAQIANTRAGLEALQSLYGKGAIDPEFATKDGSKVAEDVANGKFGIFFDGLWTGYWPLQGNVSADENADWMPIPVPSITEEPAKVSGEATTLHEFHVVRKGFEHPEALIQMLNIFDKYNNDPETADFEHYNTDPATNTNLSALSPVGVFDPLFNLNTSGRIAEAFAENDPSKVASIDQVFYDQILDYNENGNRDMWCVARSYGPGGALEVCKYYADNQLNLANKFNGVSTDAMVEKKPVLDKLWLELQTRVIMGADISDYDVFIEGYPAAGGDVMKSEVNSWYSEQK